MSDIQSCEVQIAAPHHEQVAMDKDTKCSRDTATKGVTLNVKVVAGE